MAYKGFKGIGPLKYGSAFKNVVTDPAEPSLVEPLPGQPLLSDEEVMSETIDTQYGQQPVITSDMTTGVSGH